MVMLFRSLEVAQFGVLRKSAFKPVTPRRRIALVAFGARRQLHRQWTPQGGVSDSAGSNNRKIPQARQDGFRNHRTSKDDYAPQRRPQNGSPSRRTPRDDHIPLEGATSARGLIPGLEKLDSQDSTMTPAEQSAFDKLLQLKRPAAPSTPSPGNTEPKHLPKPAKHVTEEAQRTAAANQQIADLDHLFNHASTDIDLWNTLIQNVMTKVVALDLDSLTFPEAQKLKNRWGLAKPSNKSTPSPDQLKLITQTVPQHLLDFVYAAQRHFPSSDVGLNVLPMLRDLGPSALALGARTSLYNAHIYLLTHKYFDIGAVLAELEDMDRNVFVYNYGTVGMVQWMLREVAAMKSGEKGEGLRAWAQLEVTEKKESQLRAMERKMKGVRHGSMMKRAESEMVDLEM